MGGIEQYGPIGGTIMLLTNLVGGFISEKISDRVVILVPLILCVIYALSSASPFDGDLWVKSFKGLEMGFAIAGLHRAGVVLSGRKKK